MGEGCGNGDRTIALNQFEWSVDSFSMSSIIVCEFEGTEGIQPLFWMRSAVDGQISFDLLIHSFCSSVRLWMIGSGKVGSDI